jgi:hypothetical protein
MIGWVLLAVVLFEGWALVWTLRVMFARLTAQLAVLTVVTHEVMDKIVELDEELHRVDEGRH